MTAKYEYADKYVSKLEDIPTVQHWAILEHQCIWGDDPQGRDATDCVKYEVYLTEEKWKNKIQYLEENKKTGSRNYRAVKVLPAQIEIKTEVSIN